MQTSRTDAEPAAFCDGTGIVHGSFFFKILLENSKNLWQNSDRRTQRLSYNTYYAGIRQLSRQRDE